MSDAQERDVGDALLSELDATPTFLSTPAALPIRCYGSLTMPELPEVESFRLLAEAVALGRHIRQVQCANDSIVLEGGTPAGVARRLRGREVRAVQRWGKHVWFELDRTPWPLFHFGMTGTFRTPSHVLDLVSAPARQDEPWPPRFTKLRLTMDDGNELVMTNARRLGRIRLRNDPRNEPPLNRLGFDPLVNMPTLPAFRSLLAQRHGTIKGVLLDQTFAAGVGNWVADEVLFQAGVAPTRRINSLDRDEIQSVHASLREVIRMAVRVGANAARFPKGWLFHQRWGKRSDAKTVNGEPIEHVKVAGRTTAWVPARQR